MNRQSQNMTYHYIDPGFEKKIFANVKVFEDIIGKSILEVPDAGTQILRNTGIVVQYFQPMDSTALL